MKARAKNGGDTSTTISKGAGKAGKGKGKGKGRVKGKGKAAKGNKSFDANASVEVSEVVTSATSTIEARALRTISFPGLHTMCLLPSPPMV